MADKGRSLWFLNTLVTIHASYAEGEDKISLLEHCAAKGDSPPLHVHHGEDEAFFLLEGEMRLQVGEEVHRLQPGQALLGPKGVPHTYCVDSPKARWLTVTTGCDFERFVRALGRPAKDLTLPPAAEPTAGAVRLLAETARAHGIEILGPPLG